MLKVVLIKFRGYVTTIAIKYQKLVATKCIISYILVKYVLKLLEANLISYLAILTNANCLV